MKETLQILPTEIFKTKYALSPVIMENVFNFKNLAYNFRNAEKLSTEAMLALLNMELKQLLP